MKTSKSFKIGRVEVCIIPPKLTDDERRDRTLEYYKDVTMLAGIAVGLLKIIGGLQ